MQPGWFQPVRQEFMENECEALPGVAYPRVRDNRSTLNTKTGYDDDDEFLNFKSSMCDATTQSLSRYFTEEPKVSDHCSAAHCSSNSDTHQLSCLHYMICPHFDTDLCRLRLNNHCLRVCIVSTVCDAAAISSK